MRGTVKICPPPIALLLFHTSLASIDKFGAFDLDRGVDLGIINNTHIVLGVGNMYFS